MSVTLRKLRGVWRTYESTDDGGYSDGRYSVCHSQNGNIWTVNGGPLESYPQTVAQVYFRTLAECRVEIARREATAGR